MTAENSIVYTHKAKCRDCNRCVRVCPVKSIRIERNQAFVIPELCISCGNCISECPQNAKTYRRDVHKVMQFLDQNLQTVISLAPSFSAYYEKSLWKRLPSALRQVGFMYIGETSVGAWHTSQATAKQIQENPNKTYITSACPAVVNYIELYSEQAGFITRTVSPMLAHARMLKHKLGNQIKFVFAGPCIAKKSEAIRKQAVDYIDAVLTFEELDALFTEKEINISMCEESDFDETPVGNSRLYPIEGGLLKTAGIEPEYFSDRYYPLTGYEQVEDMIQTIQKQKIPSIFEPLFCKGGCINGPIQFKDKTLIERKQSIINYHRQENHLTEPTSPCEVSLETVYYNRTTSFPIEFEEDEIKKVLEKTGKLTPEDELNCMACGYKSCRDKAKAILQGIAEEEMCIPYMRRRAEQRSDIIVQSSPNGILIVDNKLEIVSMNPTFRRMFSCGDGIYGKKVSYLIDPDPFERLMGGEEEEVRRTVKYNSYNLVCHQIHYALKEAKQYVAIFVDITDSQYNQETLKNIRTETILQVQELMDHQLNMAQKIAEYLGESSAKGETLLNKLIQVIGEK